ncbi:MAG: PBECR2 nuclease fold domain-containing protein [Anaerolineae bacterium]
MKKKSVISLNRVSEAFDLFRDLLTPSIEDCRDERVYVDIGDYVHLMNDKERLTRIRWIAETITNPEEVRKGHLRTKPFREVYINTVYESEEVTIGKPFIVGVDRKYGRLDFRTAMVPTPAYLSKVKKGALLWQAP